jgi:hypothetical protein
MNHLEQLVQVLLAPLREWIQENETCPRCAGRAGWRPVYDCPAYSEPRHWARRCKKCGWQAICPGRPLPRPIVPEEVSVLIRAIHEEKPKFLYEGAVPSEFTGVCSFARKRTRSIQEETIQEEPPELETAEERSVRCAEEARAALVSQGWIRLAGGELVDPRQASRARR